MDDTKFNYTSRSVIGNREEQQDYLSTDVSDGVFLAVVCDGMGGLNCGNAASITAVNEMVSIFRNRTADESIPDMFTESIDILDEQVFTLVDESGERLKAGTTIVAAAIENGSLYWMSVGDSRLYIFRNGDAAQATRDHNYQLYLDSVKNTYRPTQEDFDQSEALISFIGMGGISVMDISRNPFPLMDGDVLLLTTDGLYKAVPQEEIKRIVFSNPDISKAADLLLEQAEALAPSTRDNISFVLIKN